MPFDLDKQHILSRRDKSLKGSIDEKIAPVIDILNRHPDYYTTSSCAGRISVLAPGKTKRETRWILKSHGRMKREELANALRKLPRQKVWFRAEPMILHVTCRNMEKATLLLGCAHSSGLKRSGILMPFNANRVLIEGNDRMAAPIADGGRLLVDDSYLTFLLDEANAKLERNLGRIARFEAACREQLSARE